MASHNLCKFTNRRSFRLLSTAPRQCTTWPEQLWQGIDAVQRRFLRECGLSDEEALLHFNRPTGDSTEHRYAGFDSSFSEVARGTLRTCFCPLRRRLPRNPRHLQILSRSALGLVDVHNLFPLRWFARRVWPLCSTNFWLFQNSECGKVTVIGFTPSLHVFLCMSTRCNCSQDFSLFFW